MRGARPTVVMIHGAFCGAWVFDAWRALFAAQSYRVETPTLRHHDCGKDPPESLGTTSLLDYAADLEELISSLRQPPILLGHSMGGLLAQLLAARHPVCALVLLAPSPPWGVLPSTPFEFASAHALMLTGDFWRKRLWPSQEIATANALDLVAPEDRARIAHRLVPESGLATFETMHWALDARRASEVDTRKVACPILCFSGARDRINPPATVRRIAQRYRGRALHEELAGHSHWLIGEPGWQAIAERTLAWLDELHAERRRTKERA